MVSSDIANRHGATLTVLPTLSYSVARAARPFLVDLRRPRSTMTKDRMANASLVTTCDKQRVVSRADRASPGAMREIDRALAVHLALSEP